MLLVLCPFLAACGYGASADPQAGTLRVGFGIGPTARASGVTVLTEFLYAEPLIVHDWSGRPQRKLAQSWQWNTGGTVLTLRLKPGVRFHDGSLLTADTVVQFVRQHAARERPGFRYVTDVTAPDAQSVAIHLSRPDFFVLPELSELRLIHPDSNDLGTGPFRLITRTPVVEAERFDGYHEGRAALPGVRIVTYDTQRSAWAALMRGEVDAVQEVNRDSVEFMEASTKIATYTSVQPFYIPLLFNVRHEALRHVEVRRAIAQALDRTAIIERAMRGRGRLAESPVWPFHWAHPADPPRHSYDVAGAAAALDAAGFRLPGAGRPGEQRRRFAIRCMVYNEDPQFERIALMVQRQLFEVGVALEIELVDLRTFSERAARGDFDALLIRVQAGRAMDYTYRFWRSAEAGRPAMQNSGYRGADAILDELRHSVDDDDTRRSVSKLLQRFHDDVPAALIAWTEVTRAVDARYDVGTDGNQDPLFNIWKWRPVRASRR
ncbi:MAG TPA: ABC transporter substrate-binding protein [Vicinamibacterales bacterium]|nr:ABC transporter substrate-binding protein [Vicinamibacterales bacterium]